MAAAFIAPDLAWPDRQTPLAGDKAANCVCMRSWAVALPTHHAACADQHQPLLQLYDGLYDGPGAVALWWLRSCISPSGLLLPWIFFVVPTCLPVCCVLCAAGIDMTDAQLQVAIKHSGAWQQHLGYAQPNMRWVESLSAAYMSSMLGQSRMPRKAPDWLQRC